ncbi:Serine/threonine-protein kinase fray2 [Termitomyces sp. J132]|nr:Serine/threonine-protein kinase fray2 [Termitomyces sp. J132]
MASKSLSPTLLRSPGFIGAVEDEWQMYSDNEADYVLGSPIGFGASSIVYAATYQPPPRQNAPLLTPIPCALKVLDLDSLHPRSLALLQRETTLMSLSKHPNVLRVRGSWINGHKLYIALRLMNKGSAADVMRYGWPDGMEEDVVRCILRQALQGLNYLHTNGFIHRDIKAANMLIDDDGTVLLGDLGVAADLAEDPSQQVPERPRIGKRKSFVGTPCWMAPELIQGHQYDSSADIWSFGITALELTQGRPPRSREKPQRVLMRTIQDDPPTLDRDGGAYKYSRAFKEIVESCLVKDPSKRPTAQDLLQTSFFKGAKKKSYLVGAILKDLPPLTQRQERRVLTNSQTMQSLDSWDFTTMTVHPGLPRRLTGGDSASGKEHTDVFEMNGHPPRHRVASLRYSAELSCSTDDPDDKVTQGVDRSSNTSTPSTSPSNSGSTSDPVSSSSTSASGGSEPSPSSAIVAKLDHSGPTPAKDVRRLAPQSSFSPSSPSFSLSSSPSSFSTPSRKGLWHRVKSNIQRSPSRSQSAIDHTDEEWKQSPQAHVKKKSRRWREQLLGTDK